MFERNSSCAFDQHMLSPEFYANPYPIYHQLRDADPVHWSDAWKGWVLTRYADVTSTLRDFSRFSNVGRIDLFLEQLPEEGRGKMGPLKGHFSRAITHLDPPDHTRIRKLLKTVLSTHLVQSMRPRIEALVSELISEVQDAGRMDVIRDFAYPLPAIVLGEMLGIPPEDRDQYKKWSDDIGVGLVGTGRAALDNVERARQSLFELTDYLRPLVAQRRQHPRNDLISNLIAIEVKGDRLSERELFSTCITLILAGHGTTTNLIGNGILALLRHPDQLEALKNDPSLIEIAVEELLRYDSPLQRIWRMATEDVEIDGKHIRKGQIVLPTMGAANRDPAEFSEPDRLNIRRQDNPHVALGTGIHLCVGGPLARLQGAIAINALLRRLPSLQLETEALEWEANLFHRGLKSLPVVF
jgi:cytochrome P450